MSVDDAPGFFLDEGTPVSVAGVLEAAGFHVIRFRDAATPGDPDQVVAKIAMANAAVLVAVDADMRALARRRGVSKSRFRTLSLLKISCREPLAAGRIEQCLPYIGLRLSQTAGSAGRRLHVEVLDSSLRIHL